MEMGRGKGGAGCYSLQLALGGRGVVERIGELDEIGVSLLYFATVEVRKGVVIGKEGGGLWVMARMDG